MSRFVDHAARRRHALACAMDLFAADGYANVTYEKVAGRSGLARTGLYRYFRTREDLFEQALRQLTGDLIADLERVQADAGRPTLERLETVLVMALAAASENRRALATLVEDMLRPRPGREPIRPLLRGQILRLRLRLRLLVREGVRRGELRAVRPGDAADLLYALLAAAVQEASLGGAADLRRSERLVRLALTGLKA